MPETKHTESMEAKQVPPRKKKVKDDNTKPELQVTYKPATRGSVLLPDDIEIGTMFIVRDILPEPPPAAFATDDPYSSLFRGQREQEYRWALGVPLKVWGINLPFISACTPPMPSGGPFGGSAMRTAVIDIRRVVLARASEAYAKTFFPQPKPEPQATDDADGKTA